MLSDHYLEIPRIFTSIAEIIACLIYIMPLKKRFTGIRHYLYLISGAAILMMIQLISGELPLIFWIPGMMAAMTAMFLYIWSVCDISANDAGFLFVRAFILAEFAAAAEWQLYYYLLYIGVPHQWVLSVLIMLPVYAVIFTLAFWIDARKVFRDRGLGVTFRELMNAMLIGLTTFLINNMNFVVENPFTQSTVRANLLYIRTLVDFCGLLILFASNEQRREMYLNHELNAINEILHKQYDQYQASKENIDLINRKYHDFKHQIALIKSETDPVKKDAYLDEISHTISVYESRYETGNTVVDTILTGKSIFCHDNDITLSCVVNGNLLNFMYVMDI